MFVSPTGWRYLVREPELRVFCWMPEPEQTTISSKFLRGPINEYLQSLRMPSKMTGYDLGLLLETCNPGRVL